MQEYDLQQIKKKSAVSIIALTSRTFVLQIITFGATFLLTILISPRDFGIFYVVSAIISFLNYFSDIGLAAALIQKKTEVTREDLATTFTLQQILIFVAVLIALLFSSWIANLYKLDSSGLWLFRSLLIAFILSSMKTIPSIILERKLDFQRLVIPQILETIGFYGVAVLLAWKGLGINSFTWAVITRAVVGLIAIYIIAPWRVEIGIHRDSAKELLRFGIPFQLNSFIALIKDDLLTVFLGKVLTFSQIGYIGWGKKWAEVPLRLIMDNVIRVTFPTFSRIQDSKIILGKAIDKTIFGISLFVFPISTAMLFFMNYFVHMIPRYEKWEPAIMSFCLFVISSLFSSLSTPLTNALNAVGKIKVTLWFMIGWTVSTWILVLILTRVIGFNGVSLAMAFVSSSFFLVVIETKKIADFSFHKSIQFPFLGILIQSAVYFILLKVSQISIHWVYMIFVISIGFICYSFVIFIFEKKRILEMFSLFYEKNNH